MSGVKASFGWSICMDLCMKAAVWINRPSSRPLAYVWTCPGPAAGAAFGASPVAAAPATAAAAAPQVAPAPAIPRNSRRFSPCIAHLLWF